MQIIEVWQSSLLQCLHKHASFSTMLHILMKLSTDPLDALNSLFPSFLATSLAHSFTTVPDIRRFLALPLTNYSYTISLLYFSVFLTLHFTEPSLHSRHLFIISDMGI